MKRLFFIDPHVADFVYVPFFWHLRGKKALRKYKYFKELTSAKDLKLIFLISGYSSSLPNRLFKKIPKFLKRIILFYEIRFWAKLNKVSNSDFHYLSHSDTDKYFECDDLFFSFGYKIFDSLVSLSLKMDDRVKMFIHISHYHTFPKLDLTKNRNIYLCADNDCVMSDYFQNKFYGYNREVLVLPFFVRSEFKNYNGNDDKNNKVIITGSYHNIPISSSFFDFGIYNRLGNLCLHPDRFNLLEYRTDEDLEMLLSEYGNKTNNQSLYFKEPFYKLYQKFKYAYIPGEGTGLIGIGTLEAYSSGCIVFCKKNEIKGLGMPNGNLILVDDSEDFIKKMRQVINKTSYQFNFDKSWASKFSYDSLVSRLKSILMGQDIDSNY
jgi:hypothetical protein